MKKTDFIWLMAFASALIIISIWVRYNLPFLSPLLEIHTIPFQIILGVTVIAILRNIIGVRTVGVFGPAIVALGILLSNSGLVLGLALYINIFIFSMIVTLVIHPLAIERSHRVAIIIITIAIIITILELVGNIYSVDLLVAPLVFPVLITAWLADRFVIHVTETGWADPSKELTGTFAAIVIAYIFMSTPSFINFIGLNPETWALMILLNVILALKVNFRFSEYFRFKPILKRRITRKDILGMIKRNEEYIFKHNPASLFPYIAKDKMKIAFHQLGIPTPATYAIIQDKKDIRLAEKIMKTEKSFVIKPARGFGGGGILVVERKGKNGGEVYVAGGKEYSIHDLINHIVLILDGQYTTEWGDVAIIEEKIVTDPELANFYWRGVPDVRIIVFEGFPVMAMTRLPTKESGGLANMHKGAIGMGLSIADGKSLKPFWRGHGGIIEQHPDTKAVLTEMKIPNWPGYLEIACLAQAASRLGYTGVDIVPTNKGPMVLEVNKRPGLEIQNTNMSGLLKRLQFIEKELPENGFKPVQERVKLSQEWDKRGWE